MALRLKNSSHLYNLYEVNIIHRKRIYTQKTRMDHFKLSDEEFIMRYRLSKNNVKFIAQLISNNIQSRTKRYVHFNIRNVKNYIKFCSLFPEIMLCRSTKCCC